jgi:hypothetical protein
VRKLFGGNGLRARPACGSRKGLKNKAKAECRVQKGLVFRWFRSGSFAAGTAAAQILRNI